MAQPSAGVPGEATLQERKGWRVGGAALNQPAPKDNDPHLEVGSLFNEDMLLRREEPEQVAAADLIVTVAKQIGARTTCDEVQLELCVVMPPVRTRRIGVTPCHTVEISGKFEPLQHGDKK